MQDFLDEQNYLIDKANREGVQTFQALQDELKKYGLDSAQYLGKATAWLNNYNAALTNLNTTVGNVLGSSSTATDGLIYSSSTQGRIDAALSSSLSNLSTDTGVKLGGIQYSNPNVASGQNIYIDTIELPNVQNPNDFVEALKQLPGLAASSANQRT